MRQKKNNLTHVFLTILLLPVVILGCAVSETNPSKVAEKNAVQNLSNLQLSKQGLYRVSFRSNTIPIPLNKIHSWIIHVEASNGKFVEDAKIAVYGGMPKHKHGLPTAPRVTQNIGNGDYIIEGIKFSMSGQWEIWLNIRASGKIDKIVLKTTLP